MNQKFFICKHCGNIVSAVKESGVPIVCCGEKMSEIIPGEVEAVYAYCNLHSLWVAK